MSAADLMLVTPGLQWRDALLDMAREVSACGEMRYHQALTSFEAYLTRLEDMRGGANLLPGRSPQCTFWALDGSRLVGSSRIRHPLTPEMEEFAGHIGYDIRPGARRQGYGSRLLALTLLEAAGMGLDGVWVNCLSDNIGSARIIRSNGGVLVDERYNPSEGKVVLRHWIQIHAAK